MTIEILKNRLLYLDNLKTMFHISPRLIELCQNEMINIMRQIVELENKQKSKMDS